MFPAILLYQTPLTILSFISISWFSLNFAFTLVCVSPALSPATPLTAQCTLTPYILSTQLLWSAAAEEWVILQQPAPVLLHLLQLLCYSGSSRQMAGCRPARRERANLPAGIAGGAAGAAIDGWSPPRLGCSGRGNHAQESGQSVPDAGLPCTKGAKAKTTKVTPYKTREDVGRCTQCVGDSPGAAVRGTLG